jgi:hypothetical protein
LSVKALVRALVLLAAAGGFCVALSVAARADVVEPNSAYQPASTGLVDGASAAGADLPAAAEAEAQRSTPPKAKPTEPEIAPVAPTPAPEQQVVRQVPTIVVPEANAAPASLIGHVVHPLRIGVEHLKTTLGRVVSACEVGFGTGAGGPVLVLGLLCMAIPFIRRRLFAIRWATDEDVPEFRYVWELTPPG